MNKLNNLNCRYTFDTFVVDNTNRWNYTMCKAVAEMPTEDRYNPLFIYGNLGVGKSHLMQSIAHYILQNYSNLNVLYVTSEKFVCEMNSAVRDYNTDECVEKFKNVDVLLIDDFQFVAGKEIAQIELLDILGTLYDNGKQIILSATKLPKDIEGLSTELVSLIEHGIYINVQGPDYEARKEILMNMSIREYITNVSEEVYSYIALKFTNNIRLLRSALVRVGAHSRCMSEEVTLEVAKRLLEDLIE